MNAHTTVNSALVARNMLPLDGHCVCARCGVDTFDRDDMGTVQPHERIAKIAGSLGTHFCAMCIDLMYLEAENAANPHMRKEPPAVICPNHQEQTRRYDYVRGVYVTEFCAHCDGRGVPA